MIRYTSQHQLSITDFKTPFEQHLLPRNRWVILSQVIPWDDLAKVYHRQMSADFGRSSVNTRLVIGVLIIKHLLKLDDRAVLATLQENLYLQYFVGYSSFQTKIAFDPSLLVTLRKRMGMTAFDEWSLSVIAKIEAIETAQLENQAAIQDIEKKGNINANEAPDEGVNNDKKGNKVDPFTQIQQKEANQRNHVEGQFGTAKDAYDLNKVKAKTPETSESWIANIFFIMNIIKLLKVAQTAMAVFACSFLKTVKITISTIFRPINCLCKYPVDRVLSSATFSAGSKKKLT